MRRFAQLVLPVLACLLAPSLVRCAEQTAAAQEISRTVGLETTRQEMIGSRLDELLFRFQQLSSDIRSNAGIGEDAAKATGELENRLGSIKSDHLARARLCLGKALQNPSTAPANLQEARTAIDRAARELASLLLHAGASPAAEVFAREIRDVIDQQEQLQALTLQAQSPTPENEPPPSSSAQKLVADRLGQLLAEVGALPPSPTDALAGVRIARARKLIESDGTPKALQVAAENLDRKSFADAASRQAGGLSTLRQAEIKLRADANLQGMIRARNLLNEMLAGQKALRALVAAADNGQWQGQRQTWARRQRALAQPLQQIDSALGLEEPVRAALQATAQACSQMDSGSRVGVGPAQEQIESALAQSIEQLQQRIDDLQSLSATYRKLQEATGRLKNLQDITERHDKTIDAAVDALRENRELGGIADVEQHLAEEIARFSKGLPADNKWTAVLQRQLKIAEHGARVAADAMKNLKTAKLKQQLTSTGTALADAVDLEKKEADYLDKIWTLRQLAGDLKEISGSLGDIRDEEADLRQQFRAQDDAAKSLELAFKQEMLAKALEETNQLVGPILEAAPMKPQLDEAGKAMNDASAQLRQNKPEPAVPLAQKSEQALENACKYASELAAKAEYMAQWAAALEKLTSDAVDLLQRQILLRQKTETAELSEFSYITGEQDVLKAEADVMSQTILLAAAQAYKTAASEMGLAMEQLKGRQRDPAVEHQIKAENALRSGLEELQKALAALMQAMDLPLNITVTTDLDPLSALLFLAIQEKDLCDFTHAARESDLPRMAARQMELQKTAGEIAAIPTMSPAADNIQRAMGEMGQAVPALQKPARQPALTHEREAEKFLRMAFAQMAIILYLPPKPADEPVSSEMIMSPDDIPINSMDHWATFVKGSTGGADVNRDRAQWESLTERDRGALNENFARELPLEYRRVLKEYYEALSK